MLSVRQALTAVGSLSLCTLVFLGWWAYSLSSETKDLQKDYAAATDKVELAEARYQKIKDAVEELDLEAERLDQQSGKKDTRLGADAGRVADLEATAAVLRDRMPAQRQVLAWLSFALTGAGTDQLEAEKSALGGDLDPSRIALSDVTQKADVLMFSGEALFKEDVQRFQKRMEAAGYLSRIESVDVTQRTDKARNKPYVTFRLSAQLEYPTVPDLGDEP